ncbi:MAG: response regulator [Deltaproteobacteria bacterium]|nr:response regulator [Deltaproteobacteria bacterium]
MTARQRARIEAPAAGDTDPTLASHDESVAVLIVDDRPENIVALQAVLSDLPLDVVAAGSGREALGHLLRREFAVILLDVLMPEMDGFATATIIRERARTRHVPIIFLTAVSHQDEYVARGYDLGAVDYIAKPFHPEILRAKVSVFVELHRKNAQLHRQALMLQEGERREREREREALRRWGEARYQRMAESMPLIVWVADAEGRATYANRRWFEYTGTPSEAMTDELFRRVIHLDDAGPMQTRWKSARAQGGELEMAARFRRDDGAYRWHLLRAVPVADPEGGVTEWIGTATDVDDRTRAEQGLRFLADASTAMAESLEYRRTLGEVCALAAPTIADWCVIELDQPTSSSFFTVGGPTPDATDVARRAIADRSERLTSLFRPSSAGPPDAREVDPVDDTPITAKLSVPLTVRGAEIGSLRLAHSSSGRSFGPLDEALAQDLARRIGNTVDNARLYEQSQTERTALEAAARSKDEFLAVLSHELRTPLHTTLGWAQMLRTGTLDRAAFEMGLDTIERGVRTQVRLVDDLLDISSIVTGKLRLSVGPIDLAQVVRDSVESVKPAAEAKQIELQLELPRNGAPMNGDAARLQQVVWNLLSNAIKFTPRGGRIRVVVERLEDQLVLSVEDDGEGIDPEFLPFVFDRFRQANSSITRRYNGLGLGLSIVRHLVELHGGRCRADSAGLSHGTTMWVELPTTTTSTRARLESASAQASARLTGAWVLVVDDLVEGRALFQVMLEAAGAHVETVSSVRDAWSALTSHRVDVLVSDIGLPGESGYDLIQRVRTSSDPALRKLPAIALTAYASDADRRACLTAGFDGHLAKPIEHELLVSTLRSLLDERRGSQPPPSLA